MSNDIVSVSTYCKGCGIRLDSAHVEVTARQPCPACGDLRQSHDVTLGIVGAGARVGLSFKARHPGSKKAHGEVRTGPDMSVTLGKDVHKYRMIDRDGDRYVEYVDDYESGEVLHHDVEPLSEHVGHGSAKQPKGAK